MSSFEDDAPTLTAKEAFSLSYEGVRKQITTLIYNAAKGGCVQTHFQCGDDSNFKAIESVLESFRCRGFTFVSQKKNKKKDTLYVISWREPVEVIIQ
jgi:hypothetical protein